MINESARRQEVWQIWINSRDEMRLIYNMGTIIEAGKIIDNWIIRWCLWHVYRYRDSRNRRTQFAPSLNAEPLGSQPMSAAREWQLHSKEAAENITGKRVEKRPIQHPTSLETCAKLAGGNRRRILPFDPARDS